MSEFDLSCWGVGESVEGAWPNFQVEDIERELAVLFC